MPPKVEASSSAKAESVEFVFEKDRMIKKFNEDIYIVRQKIMETCSKHVLVKTPKDPTEKLKERINTYHNLRKMKTDYKNYVKRYGNPSFYVPEELWRKN